MHYAALRPEEAVNLRRPDIAEFTDGAAGRVFYGVSGGELPNITYRRAWKRARTDALTADQAASPLAERPYDLRHAAARRRIAQALDDSEIAARRPVGTHWGQPPA